MTSYTRAKLGCQHRPVHAHVCERSYAQTCLQSSNERGRPNWEAWTKTNKPLQCSRKSNYKFHGRMCGGTTAVTAEQRGERYSVFLLSLTTARQLYHTESVHPPRHLVTAAAFRTAIKDTPSNRRFTSCVPSYFLCAKRYSSFLFAIPWQSASWVIPISHITTIQFFPQIHFLTELSLSFAI